MKNFKLLLATTAILSTGAFIANADESVTTTLNVRAGIVVPDVIIPVQDIDFGDFILNASDIGQSFSVTMDPATGNVDYDGARKIRKSQNGQVVLTMQNSSLKTILLPHGVLLNEDYSNKKMQFIPTFTLIDSVETGTYSKKTYGIGGTFSDVTGGVYEGNYTGELTITVIADTGN